VYELPWSKCKGGGGEREKKGQTLRKKVAHFHEARKTHSLHFSKAGEKGTWEGGGESTGRTGPWESVRGEQEGARKGKAFLISVLRTEEIGKGQGK